jgi:NADPH2:quinone reductase
MKAIRVHQFGGPEQLKLEEVPDPKPSAGEVVVRVRAAGVNPYETYMRTGTYAMKPNLPYTPGSDAAGEVLAVGKGVSRWKPGDRVYLAGSISGTYAEQALCKESQIHRLPDQVSFQQGAAIGVPYATAYRALFQKAQVRPAETVLIHGASGGVGTAAVQLARAHGCIVIGTAGTEEGRKQIIREGAHYALDHHAADLADQIKKLTDGKGVDVVLEMLANKNFVTDLQALALYGRIVIIGNRGTIEINPRDIMGRDANVIGMVLFNASEKEVQEIHAGLVAALEANIARPLIGREFPLADAAKAHEVVAAGGTIGKVVLLP